jgi:hypothetical protein
MVTATCASETLVRGIDAANLSSAGSFCEIFQERRRVSKTYDEGAWDRSGVTISRSSAVDCNRPDITDELGDNTR